MQINASRLEREFPPQRAQDAAKGIEVEGPVARACAISQGAYMPSAEPKGYVHPNPVTRKPYQYPAQWERSWESQTRSCPKPRGSEPEMVLYKWSIRDASALAASESGPGDGGPMMGEKSLATVLRHYFNSDLRHMQAS